MKEHFELADTVGVIAEAVACGGSFTLYPMGTSMLPTIKASRDSVTLVKAEGLKKGDIILYKRADGKFVLHRIVKLSNDGSYVLCGDNQRTFEKNVMPENVLFLVEEYERNGKRVKRNSLAFRIHWHCARMIQLAKAVLRRMLSAFCRNGR